MSGPNLKEITTGLRFPEGPVALSDGSVLVVEIETGRLTRVAADGTKTTISQHTGGPNGAAIGPDGKGRAPGSAPPAIASTTISQRSYGDTPCGVSYPATG